MAFQPHRSPQIVAHMGDTSRAAANTLAAFEAAVHSGADMIEVDVSVTLDAVPVATHGPRLEAWTDGAGKVHQVRFETIAALQARLSHQGDYSGEPVPSLAAVLERIGGRLPLNLDIKRASALAPTVALLDDPGADDWGVMSGLTAGSARRALRHHPGLSVLVNLTSFDRFIARFGRFRARWLTRRRMRRLLSRDDVVALNVNHQFVDQELVDAVHACGAQLWVFTVRDRSSVEALTAMGVDSVTVEGPGGLR